MSQTTNEWETPTEDEWGAAADTNEWDAGEDTNEWDAGEDTNAWGDTEEESTWSAATPSSSMSPSKPVGTWGEIPERHEEAPAWQAESQEWASEQEETGYTPPSSTDWHTNRRPVEEPDAFDAVFGESEHEDQESWPASPRPERKAKPLLILLAVGGVLVLVAAVVVGFLLFNNASGDEPAPEPTAQVSEEPALAPELEQLQPFAESLGTALTERDAEAYYDLFSADSQDVHDIAVAEAAIDSLPAGASYEATITGGSVAGPTAVLQISLDRTYNGETTSNAMRTELVKEGEDWKMVVKADNES